MSTVDFVYVNAGGGHRASATALSESIQRQNLPWNVRLVALQQVLDPIDVVRKVSGVRLEDLYNFVLKRGWTLGSRHSLKLLQAVVRAYHQEEVRLLREHWVKTKPDIVVSVMPHFNRAFGESLADLGIPFVTILTDFADFPPHFWIEKQDQDFICGSARAVEQASQAGIARERIHRSSGMIVHPRFYEPVSVDRAKERIRLGLDPEMRTGLVMFGGLGSESMMEIAKRVDESDLQVQLIFICGHNQALEKRLRSTRSRFPRFVEGFTKEMPYYMSIADFFIGKPGPGSISEALLMKLPVIVQENAWTLPQERYNAQWIRENEVGLVLRSFREIVPAIRDLLAAESYRRFRENAVSLNNRAVFEIPAILEKIMAGAMTSAGLMLRSSHTEAKPVAS